MIPQPYPLYARFWMADDHDDFDVFTAAVVAWVPDPEDDDCYMPVIAPLGSNGELAFPVRRRGRYAWSWRLTTDPADDWTPAPEERPQRMTKQHTAQRKG